MPPDIELLISAIELLRDRENLEVSAFVERWDSQLSYINFPEEYAPPYVIGLLNGLQDSNYARGRLTIAKAFRDAYDSFTKATPNVAFSRLYDEMFRRVVKTLRIDSTRTSYIEPLVRASIKETTACVSTLNYDLLFETVANRISVSFSRGTDTWNDDWNLTWPEASAQLVKLHGSIDWRRERRVADHFTGLEYDSLQLVDPDAAGNTTPFLIYGRREKLRPDGPFLQLRSHFIHQVKKASKLVVIGYSFADAHVNEIIRRWLNLSEKNEIYVIDPCFPALGGSFNDRSSFTRDLCSFLVTGPSHQGRAYSPRREPAKRLYVLRQSLSEIDPRFFENSSDMSEIAKNAE